MADSLKHVEKKVVILLKKYPELLKDKETNKLKCSLSGHEMPCTALAINTYVSGKKFKKLREKNKFNYEDHKKNLVPSIKKFHEKHLYCFLTQSHINDNPEDIERYINGRKYKRALAEWKRCQKTGERFKPFGNLTKHKQDDDEDGGVMSDGSDQFGDGGFLDSDPEPDSKTQKKDEEEDNFSDLYPDESDDGKAESGSDYDFDAMAGKPTGLKPKVPHKKHNVKKNEQKETVVQKKKKNSAKVTSVTSVPKKLSKVSKVTKPTLPNKKKLKRLAST